MKKYICLSIIIFLCSTLFSQEDSINRNDYEWKISMVEQDFKDHTKANQDPIVKRIYDVSGNGDYLEQHFYHNGNLYYQVPVKNGKENGLYEEYHPNGQLRYNKEMKDGYYIKECNFISFDRFGDTSCIAFCMPYHDKLYSFKTDYIFGKPFSLMIRDSDVLVAEFRWTDRRWVKHDYHCRSVKYAGKLLKLYKKKRYNTQSLPSPNQNSD